MPANPVAELNQAVDGLNRIAREIVDTGSTAARQAILNEVASRRGTLSVSGLGATLDVAITPGSASETAAQASLRPTPAGAWGLVDKGAKPHTERRRRGMPAAPYGVFSRIEHPGTAGLNVAAPARAAADQATTEAARAAFERLPRHA